MFLAKPSALDLGILFAASKKDENFELQKEMAIKILSAFTVLPEATRVAAASYGVDANINFKLGEFANLHSKLGEFENIKSLKKTIKDLANPTFGRSLFKGLEVSYDMLLDDSNGARFGIPKSLLVFVSTNIDRAFASQLKKLENVKVVAIGIGEDVVQNDVAALGRNLFKEFPLVDPSSIYFRHPSDYSDVIKALKIGKNFLNFLQIFLVDFTCFVLLNLK